MELATDSPVVNGHGQQPVVKVQRRTALRQAQGVLSLPKDEGGEAPR